MTFKPGDILRRVYVADMHVGMLLVVFTDMNCLGIYRKMERSTIIDLEFATKNSVSVKRLDGWWLHDIV